MVKIDVGKNKKIDVISYLGPQTSIDGDIHTDNNLHIDGKLNGNIICNGDLIIGDSSKIYGKVTANNIVVSGYFEGTLEAINHLEIKATGHVEGDIKGSQLTIREGGIYKGKVNMDVIEAQSLYEDSFKIIK